MLARLHIIVFLLICLISSALGTGLTVGILRFFSSSKTFNAFGDIIAALTLVPLGFVAPSLVLFSVRREQKQSLREFYADQARREAKILSPNEHEAIGDELIDAEQDHYGVLRLDSTASQADIEKSYYDILDELSENGLESEFAHMQAAYAVLGNPETRVKYDLARLLKQNGARVGAFVRKDHEDRSASARTASLSFASVVLGLLLLLGGAVLTFVALEILYERHVFA